MTTQPHTGFVVPQPPPPASLLLGRTLEGGWTVTGKRQLPLNFTGSNFSFGYTVIRIDGLQGFLKALDFMPIWDHQDFMRELQRHTEAYNFERDLLLLIRSKRMSRVVTAITDGWVDVPGYGPLSRVPYLIFERADDDVRAYLDSEQFDTAWRLRVLHQVATGLRQLHGGKITHQDLKPSNVLVFPTIGSRIADLGRAVVENQRSPFESMMFPGDPAYAPIECLYNYCDPDWRRHRIGADLYMLGSLILFFFARVSMNAALLATLAESHTPQQWPKDYMSVLPYIRDAFDRICTIFGDEVGRFAPEVANDLAQLLRYLCDPDPTLRGHPADRRTIQTQHSLERFITKLDLMAARAEIEISRRRR